MLITSARITGSTPEGTPVVAGLPRTAQVRDAAAMAR
jgi:hypothetical protein